MKNLEKEKAVRELKEFMEKNGLKAEPISQGELPDEFVLFCGSMPTEPIYNKNGQVNVIDGRDTKDIPTREIN